jgi:hypothetical protein
MLSVAGISARIRQGRFVTALLGSPCMIWKSALILVLPVFSAPGHDPLEHLSGRFNGTTREDHQLAVAISGLSRIDRFTDGHAR